MDAVKLGGDAVLQHSCLRLTIYLFLYLVIDNLVALANAIHSNGLDAVIWAFAQCGIRQRAKMTRLMIRDFIYSLFSFVILDPFPDKRYHIEVVSDAYQIKPGCIPVHREDAYRL